MVIGLIAAIGSNCSAASKSAKKDNPMEHDPEYVICAYGCFIWAKENFKTFLTPSPGKDVRKTHPEREPLAGWYDDSQEAFDGHLKDMAKCGLDVLVIDWYPVHVGADPVYTDSLHNGTRFMMGSKLDVPVKFCISLINHSPFAMKTDEHWKVSMDQWIKAFKHPKYWKIEGKPVFTVHSSWHLDQHEGSPQKSAERIAALRKRVRDEGFPGILIAGGVSAQVIGTNVENQLKAHGYDFVTFYNKPNWQPYQDKLDKEKDFVLPYRKMMEAHFEEWRQYRKNVSIPFSPYVTIQWDPQPWWGSSPAHSMRYEDPTDDELREFLAQARQCLDSSPKYRIPTADGKGVKAVFICAWNELSEGSFICPTKGLGDKRMRIINEVFRK